MAKRIVEIKKGETSLIRLFSGPSSWEESDFAVTDLEGIENWENVEIETTPKLFGSGSYVVSKRITEKQIKLSGHVFSEAVNAIYEGLKTAAEALDPVSLQVTTPAHAMESIAVYITGVDWRGLSEESAEFSISLLAPEGTIN